MFPTTDFFIAPYTVSHKRNLTHRVAFDKCHLKFIHRIKIIHIELFLFKTNDRITVYRWCYTSQRATDCLYSHGGFDHEHVFEWHKTN